jgi:hypothetical protein
MSADKQDNEQIADEPSPPARPPTKKDQILALFLSGLGDISDIALITRSRPSYVAGVLQEAGLHHGYFDLYTSTAQPMNVYSKYFAGQMGFRDVETAEQSVALIDRLYRQFELAGDRAGQHHALLMALTMFDRARWTNKSAEAEPFRQWLLTHLQEASGSVGNSPASSSAGGPPALRKRAITSSKRAPDSSRRGPNGS